MKVVVVSGTTFRINPIKTQNESNSIKPKTQTKPRTQSKKPVQNPIWVLLSIADQC